MSYQELMEGVHIPKITQPHIACNPNEQYNEEKIFRTNNIAVFPEIENFLYYDFYLSKHYDLYSNFKFENVDHVKVVVSDLLCISPNFSESFVYVACANPYSKVYLRLYFPKNNVPPVFKISYDYVFFSFDLRKRLSSCSFNTDTHVYHGGEIKEKL